MSQRYGTGAEAARKDIASWTERQKEALEEALGGARRGSVAILQVQPDGGVWGHEAFQGLIELLDDEIFQGTLSHGGAVMAGDRVLKRIEAVYDTKEDLTLTLTLIGCRLFMTPKRTVDTKPRPR